MTSETHIVNPYFKSLVGDFARIKQGRKCFLVYLFIYLFVGLDFWIHRANLFSISNSAF